jgi:hypothetical protein
MTQSRSEVTAWRSVGGNKPIILKEIGCSGVLTGEKKCSSWTWGDNKGVSRGFADTPVAMAREVVRGALDVVDTKALDLDSFEVEELDEDRAKEVLNIAREMRRNAPKYFRGNRAGTDRQSRVMTAMAGEVVAWLLGLACKVLRRVLTGRPVKTTWEFAQSSGSNIDDEILGWLFRR